MPARTGKKEMVLVKLEGEFLKKFETIKKSYGVEANSEVIRLLVTERCEELGLGPELPRFEQINSDENGVKILDRQLHRVADVYFKRAGIHCILDDSDECAHVTFALAQKDVQKLIRQKRAQGWKLPDV